MNARQILSVAAFIGAFSIAAGAFGAHGLKKIFSPEILQTFETAVRYEFYHVFALLIVGMLLLNRDEKLFRLSALFFLSGILLFSGSLYLLCVVKWKEMAGWYWLGAITPFGGVCFIAGWLFLMAGILKRN